MADPLEDAAREMGEELAGGAALASLAERVPDHLRVPGVTVDGASPVVYFIFGAGLTVWWGGLLWILATGALSPRPSKAVEETSGVLLAVCVLLLVLSVGIGVAGLFVTTAMTLNAKGIRARRLLGGRLIGWDELAEVRLRRTKVSVGVIGPIGLPVGEVVHISLVPATGRSVSVAIDPRDEETLKVLWTIHRYAPQSLAA